MEDTWEDLACHLSGPLHGLGFSMIGFGLQEEGGHLQDDLEVRQGKVQALPSFSPQKKKSKSSGALAFAGCWYLQHLCVNLRKRPWW